MMYCIVRLLIRAKCQADFILATLGPYMEQNRTNKQWKWVMFP